MKITNTILIIINAISRAVNKDWFTGNYTATIAKIFSLFFIFQVVSTSVIAQQFPVQVTPQLLPPYTVKISDYYNSAGSPKLNLLLLLRDFNRGSIQVRLRMSIESQQVRITTRPEAQFNAVTIFSGVPYAMAPNELEQYFNPNNLLITGISPTQYLDKLPEGFYTFCFEAVDAVTGLTLSNKGCGFSWLNLNEPPMLNIPRKAESVTPADNILFNWTPRHLSNPTANDIGYTLTLVELLASSTNPEADFNVGVPITTLEINTGATTTTYQPAGTMTPGRRYAWRVRARPNTGISNASGFKNDGNSEIFWFTYQNACEIPTGIASTPSVTSAQITWLAKNEYLDYKVIYREKANDKAEWFALISNSPAVVFTDLKAGTVYEYRVGAACEQGNYSFAATQEFTTKPNNVSTIPTADCGIEPTILPPGTELLEDLLVDQEFTAYDFSVVVKKVTKISSGIFSGEGYVKVPLLSFIKLAVTFNSITISADRKLKLGTVQTVYDPTGANIFSSGDFKDIVDVFTAGYGVGKTVTGEIIIDKTVDFVITNPTNISATPPVGYNEATGTVAGGAPITVTITRADGAPYTFTTDHLPVTIADSQGNIYQLGKDGHTVTSLGNNKGADLFKSMNPKLIDNDKALVNFVHADGETFALDVWNSTYEKSTAFNQEYEIIEQVADGEYHVNAKAIAPEAIDKIKAVITLPTGSTVIPADIKFVNSKGMIYTNTTYDAASKSFTIQIVGGPAKDGQDIYAVYKPATGKTLNLGKIMVASYEKKIFKVELIAVNGAKINKESVSQKLNSIYNKIGISWVVSKNDKFKNSSWDVPPAGLDVSSSGFLSNLSDEMKALNNAYRNNFSIDKETIYLFVLDQAAPLANGQVLLGDMPRGKQFGYLFNNVGNGDDLGTTAAHEIGHGMFSLLHAFDYVPKETGTISPSNVMDYPAGENFVKRQWDLLHDPSLFAGLFDGDDDSKLTLELAYKDEEPNELTEIVFDLPADATTCNNYLTQHSRIIKLDHTFYSKVIIDKGFIVGIVTKDQETFRYSLSYQLKTLKEPALTSDGKEVTKQIFSLAPSVSFINWARVKKDEQNEVNEITSFQCLDFDKIKSAKVYNFNDADHKYKLNYNGQIDCDGSLQVVESFDADKNPICRNLTKDECESFKTGNSVFGGERAEVVKSCGPGAYNQAHQLLIQQADNTVVWGEKIVKRLNYLITKNKKNKFGDNLLTVDLKDVEYIVPGTNTHNENSFKAGHTLEELNQKMAYLEVSTGYQFYTEFIESWCTFSQTDADEFATDIFNSCLISQEKGIFCLVLHNSKLNYDNPLAYTVSIIFGRQVSPTDRNIVTSRIKSQEAMHSNIAYNYTISLIQAYQAIPKKQILFSYFFTKPDLAEKAARSNLILTGAPYYALTGKAWFNKEERELSTGNAVAIEYYLKDGETLQQIINRKRELKEEFVAGEGKYAEKLGLIYAVDFAEWDLTSKVDGQNSNSKPIEIDHDDECFYTLNKSCSKAIVDDVLFTLALLPLPQKYLILPLTAMVVNFSLQGEFDQAALVIIGYGIGTSIIPAFKFVSAAFITIKAKVSNYIVALSFKNAISQAIRQGAENLFAKELSSSCAEYFIPDVTHKNLFLKFNITSSGTKEVLVSYVEKENGIDKIFYLGYKENVNVIIPGAVDELTASDISQIAKIALAEGKLPGLLSKLGHTPNLYRVINALDESIVEHAALIQKIDGLVSEPNKLAQLETLAGDDLYASVSSSYNKASYFADVVAGTGKFTKYPKVYFWLKDITDASARANVDNIITNWSDDLLKKLNFQIGRSGELANEIVLNTSLLNHFKGSNTGKWYKYGLLREHYRTGAGSITLPPRFLQIVEEFETLRGTSIATEFTNAGAISANQRSQKLGLLLEDELLPEIGRGFTNGGNFSHLPPSVEQKLNEIYQDGYTVMTTQMECSVNGRSPVPDNLFFKKDFNGNIDFDNAIAMDVKLNANYGYDDLDPQRILALTQGTGTQFLISRSSKSVIFGELASTLSLISEQPTTLKSFSKIGTTLENDIYTLIHKPYNPR